MDYLLKPFYEDFVFTHYQPYKVDRLSTDPGKDAVLPHFHKFLELVYFYDGRGGTVTVEGRSYPYRRGDLIVVKPYAMHAYAFRSRGQKFLLFRLDCCLFLQLFEKALLEKTVFEYIDHFHYIHPVQARADTRLVKLLEALPAGSYTAALAAILQVQGFLPQSQPRAAGTPSGFAFAKVLAHLEANYSQDIKLQELADICYLSKYHFSRTFKKVYAMGWVQFLHKIRIEKAESLLLYTDQDVTEISYAVGFPDTSYFIKRFKQYHLLTPTVFRQKNKPR